MAITFKDLLNPSYSTPVPYRNDSVGQIYGNANPSYTPYEINTGFTTPGSVSDFTAQQAMYGGLQDRSLDFSQNGLNGALGITDQNPLGNKPNLSALDKLQNGWSQMNLGQQAGAILGGVGSLYGMYNARKTGQLARDQLNFTKDSFNRNFEAQAKTTNAQLADRQNARHARDPKAHASVADYMKKYGV